STTPKASSTATSTWMAVRESHPSICLRSSSRFELATAGNTVATVSRRRTSWAPVSGSDACRSAGGTKGAPFSPHTPLPRASPARPVGPARQRYFGLENGPVADHNGPVVLVALGIDDDARGAEPRSRPHHDPAPRYERAPGLEQRMVADFDASAWFGHQVNG